MSVFLLQTQSSQLILNLNRLRPKFSEQIPNPILVFFTCFLQPIP